jgi:hypothetical protein
MQYRPLKWNASKILTHSAVRVLESTLAWFWAADYYFYLILRKLVQLRDPQQALGLERQNTDFFPLLS